MIKHENNDNDFQDTSGSVNQVSAAQILKLAQLTDIKQILTSIKLAYFPFAGFVLQEPDEEGLKILYEYSEVFLKIRNYLVKKESLDK